jgi:hypothetical protein
LHGISEVDVLLVVFSPKSVLVSGDNACHQPYAITPGSARQKLTDLASKDFLANPSKRRCSEADRTCAKFFRPKTGNVITTHEQTKSRHAVNRDG